MKLKNIQVEMPVENLERAKEFYEKLFGFVIKKQNNKSIEFDNNIILKLKSAKTKAADLSQDSPKILFWVESIAIAYKSLIDQRVRVESPPKEGQGSKYLYFHDSENNLCKVLQSDE